MNAGKSANLIMTHHNYKELGLKPVVVVPNGSKNKRVYSRIGIGLKAIRFNELNDYLRENRTDCILVDEVQFLSKEEIDDLNFASLYQGATVICYGLRTTSTGELFEGSKHLMAIADIMEELPTLCFCGRKARMNLRVIDGKVDTSKEVVKLREEQSVAYISVCRSCFDKYYSEMLTDVSHLVKKYDNTKGVK